MISKEDTFRKFRDNYLANTPNGKMTIDEYYAIAPDIVCRIDKYENSNAIKKTTLTLTLEALGRIFLFKGFLGTNYQIKREDQSGASPPCRRSSTAGNSASARLG